MFVVALSANFKRMVNFNRNKESNEIVPAKGIVGLELFGKSVFLAYFNMRNGLIWVGGATL